MKAELDFPAGFRFHPTDEELVSFYLCRKCAMLPIQVPIIAEIDLYKYDPWQLPDMAAYGEKEWYFFSPRDRKYPNGSRPNRAAGTGYWKATGADKPIGKPSPLGIKKALVFYAGKAPKGIKTNWIMHEYRLANVDRSARKKNNNLRLDDWVLCRIYNKKGVIDEHYSVNEKPEKKSLETKPNPMSPQQQHWHVNDLSYIDISESKLHTDSSSSEHVTSSEVESEQKWNEWESTFAGLNDIDFNYMTDDLFSNQPQYQLDNQLSTLQDMFLFR